MSNFSTLFAKTTLPAALLAACTLICSAQTQSTPPATKPAPKKSGTATTTTKTTPSAKAAAPLTTPKDKLSYSIGTDIGKKLKAQSIDVDPAVVSRGIKDAFTGAKPAMTDEEMKSSLTSLQTQMREKQMAMIRELAEKNKKEGEAFLAANKSKEGVVTLPSGLEYKILKAGDGKKPAASDTVECNYRGTLIDGTEFDSSYKRGESATFPVSGVIKGWTEALQLMPVGSKWQLFIPSELAYGERGAGGDIAPNSTLIFEVELLSIKPPEEQKK